MIEELRCPYCNKSCSSKSGLTNHMKTCKPTGTGTRISDPRDVDPRVRKHDVESPGPSRPSSVISKQKVSNNGLFDIGAFKIFEHLLIMLDLNFAAALADHILKHGSENRAILAFGHQLAKVSGED